VVSSLKPLIAIWTFHEFVTESGPPVRSIRRGIGERTELKPARGLAANDDGEGIVEAQRVHDFQVETRGVLAFGLVVHAPGVAFYRLLQNGGERSAGVLHIGVDSPRQQRLMADVGAGEIKPPLHVQPRLRFQMLRKHLAQDSLLGEVLRSNHQRLLPPRAARREGQGAKQIAEGSRETKPPGGDAPAHADT
jgi:hypothetical protein